MKKKLPTPVRCFVQVRIENHARINRLLHSPPNAPRHRAPPSRLPAVPRCVPKRFDIKVLLTNRQTKKTAEHAAECLTEAWLERKQLQARKKTRVLENQDFSQKYYLESFPLLLSRSLSILASLSFTHTHVLRVYFLPSFRVQVRFRACVPEPQFVHTRSSLSLKRPSCLPARLSTTRRATKSPTARKNRPKGVGLDWVDGGSGSRFRSINPAGKFNSLRSVPLRSLLRTFYLIQHHPPKNLCMYGCHGLLRRGWRKNCLR